MPEILHITPQLRWEHAQTEGEYRGDTLVIEGFIHGCLPEQVAGVVSRYFKGQTGLVLLRIDPSKLKPQLKWENPPDSDETFPHVYGPLNLDAVVEVMPLEIFLSGETGV